MKANKLLLGSFVLAGLVSACANEEIVVAEQGNTEDLSNRTQVDLSFGLPVESRMAATGENKLGQSFTKNDLLGAVLVDGGYKEDGTNQIDWTRVKGHVGNNKWAWNEKSKAFETAGTTSVGAWLFYTKYNELMTTTRDGVKFSFPQIQEGAADFTYLANNNANFMITPVLAIDGYEGSKFDLEMKYASVYNYLNLKFDFSGLEKEVKQVQKIIVKATKTDGSQATFPTYGRVVNDNVPMAELSLEVNDEVHVGDVNCDGYVNATDQNLAISFAYDKLRYREYQKTGKGDYKYVNGSKIATEATELWASAINYKPIVEAVDETKNAEYLVVDFETEHADKLGNGGLAVDGGLFSAYMLMPSGVYGSVTFEIYTDAGVYTKNVSTRNAFIENEVVAQGGTPTAKKGERELFFRPNVATVLSNIEGVSTTIDGKEVSDYLKVADRLENGGDVITKTADLVNFINGITASGEYELTVITQGQIGDENKEADDNIFKAHTAALINKAVMDAIEAKEAEVGDIQLVLNSIDPIAVIGEQTANAPLYIHDIQFNNSCVIKNGYVTVGDAKRTVNTALIIPKDQKMLVKSGVNLVLDNMNQQYDNFEKIEIEAGAKVTIKNYLWINKVVNAGTIVAETELESETVENSGSIDAKNMFAVSENLTNWGTITSSSTMDVVGKLVNKKYATITNHGVMTLNGGNADSSNDGTINNNSEISVASDLTNGGQINNAGDASIIVNTGADLNNAAGAVIDNEGSMRCANDTYNNKINNLGTINAKKGSRTYITTNSSDDEKNGTNELVMGTVVLEKRNADMSVTVGTQQGYIQYAVPATTAVLAYEQGDKFNKVVLSGNTKFDETENNRVKYIVVDSNMELTLPATATIQVIEFNADAVLNAWPTKDASARLALIKIGKDVEVTVPTENEIKVVDVENQLTAGQKKFESKTFADIQNEGEIIVGGDLYSTLPESITLNNGKFSSGDGENTAYHWGEGESTATEGNGYLMIGNTAKVFSSEGLANAINSDVESVVLAGGSYTMPDTDCSMTISGGEDAVITIDKPTAKNVTFKGVTVVGSGVYTGIQHSNKVVYENCVVKGTQCLYANNVKFKDCTVDLTAEKNYIWTYGARNVTFDECIFNTLGKAILIYCEGKATVTDVTVKNCTFNAGANEEKAAIEIDSSLSMDGHYTLTTEDNTVGSNFSGEWRIKRSGKDNTTVNGIVYNAVTVDGEVVE